MQPPLPLSAGSGTDTLECQNDVRKSGCQLKRTLGVSASARRLARSERYIDRHSCIFSCMRSAFTSVCRMLRPCKFSDVFIMMIINFQTECQFEYDNALAINEFILEHLPREPTECGAPRMWDKCGQSGRLGKNGCLPGTDWCWLFDKRTNQMDSFSFRIGIGWNAWHSHLYN